MKTVDDLKAIAKQKADANGDGKVSLDDAIFAIDHSNGSKHLIAGLSFVLGVLLTIAGAWIVR